ncbi:MAG: hypothetical protein IJI49_00580 [Bacilli bacterium]|nr:hypothetical protein [Bacilli bacterium]
MNVIVSNLNRDKFTNLNVDIIKSISGEFSADELVQTFSNFFFNRMFLDITSIQNYRDINNIQKLSIGLDVSKIILLLNDDPVINNAYISKLISMGIYNFARNENELIYLYNNPNQYRDVVRYQNMDNVSNNVNTNANVNSMNVNNSNQVMQGNVSSSKVNVIGFKNFTNHAGATSLIYMIKRQLEKNYSVISLEVNKSDFLFFNDKSMISVTASELRNSIDKYRDVNIILVDLNDFPEEDAKSLCDDIIYLIEPSTLSINKIARLEPNSFIKLRDYKVVLNDCLLNEKDISLFGREANTKIFYALPPMNDREDNSRILLPFLGKLGLYRRISNEGNDTSNNKFLKF